MADTVPAPRLLTMALVDGEQVPQTVIMSDGHHYTRDTQFDVVHVWDFHAAEMRGKGYRETTDAEAERHRARRERSLPGPHLEALRAAGVAKEDVATATPTAGDVLVVDAQKAADKAAAADAKAKAKT